MLLHYYKACAFSSFISDKIEKVLERVLIYLNRAGKTVLLSTATSLAQGPLWLMATNDALYQALFKAYTDAHPTKPKQLSQAEVAKRWNEMKKEADYHTKVNALISDLKAIAMTKKGRLLAFWGNQAVPNHTTEGDSDHSLTIEAPSEATNSLSSVVSTNPNELCTSGSSSRYKSTAQTDLQHQIDLINGDLVGAKRKHVMLDLCEKNPEVKELLKLREKSGRPRLDEDQPLLLQAIVDIALHGAPAHERRQCEVYRSIKTLDELTAQLKKDGFQISRSGTYLRLIPRRGNSIEEKRHVVTAPVQLLRSKNDLHCKHIDAAFCFETIKRLEELSSMLGPKEVCFLSQDDKARVPIGLTAATMQSPLLMHVEYRVTLPDHDWVVAGRHKLIPSVIAGIKIEENSLGMRDAVGYSGPTYIAIRSGKHCSSTAYAHGLDFQRLLEIKEFDEITKCGVNMLVKPIVIFTVDGGPDENPRYRKVIEVGIHNFLEYNLDALFIACNAPGRSAYNRVERRMAPLSKELAGVVLPHDSYGSHLDAQGRTIDKELEKKNLGCAGNVLAEIWSSVIIDKYPVVAEYIPFENSELNASSLSSKDHTWFSQHVRTSQYFTQIIKCKDGKCCSKPRSSYFEVIQQRFFPPLIPLAQTGDGLKAPACVEEVRHFFPSLFASLSLNIDEMLPRSATAFKVLPYDLYCPSVIPMLAERMCKKCSLYFATKVLLKEHCSIHNETQPVSRDRPIRIAARRQRELMTIISYIENGEHIDWMDELELDCDTIPVPADDTEEMDEAIPVVSTEEHLETPWECPDSSI